MSNTEEIEFCDANPASVMCAVQQNESQFGTARQAWKSAEYYGLSSLFTGAPASQSAPCYARNTVSCSFPEAKVFKLHLDNSACVAQPGMSQTLLGAFEEGMSDGLLSWHGHGGISVQFSTAGGAMFVNVKCGTPTTAGALAEFAANGNTHVQLNDLPVGPHGKNPNQAVQYDGGTATFSIARMWTRYKSACQAVPTPANFKAFVKGIASHEGGHMVGFDHSTGVNTLMKSDAAYCTNWPGIPSNYDTTLSQYSGSAAGGVTINDLNLQQWGIP